MTKRKVGRPSKYKPEFAQRARELCERGATDRELAQHFGVGEATLNSWKHLHPEFQESLKVGKGAADDRVELSLYRRATGYSFDAVKIFANGTVVPYVEHVPPDPTACIFWLKNRRPQAWRDVSKIDLSNQDGSLAAMFAAAVRAANGLTTEAPAETGRASTQD